MVSMRSRVLWSQFLFLISSMCVEHQPVYFHLKLLLLENSDVNQVGLLLVMFLTMGGTWCSVQLVSLLSEQIVVRALRFVSISTFHPVLVSVGARVTLQQLFLRQRNCGISIGRWISLLHCLQSSAVTFPGFSREWRVLSVDEVSRLCLSKAFLLMMS